VLTAGSTAGVYRLHDSWYTVSLPQREQLVPRVALTFRAAPFLELIKSAPSLSCELSDVRERDVVTIVMVVDRGMSPTAQHVVAVDPDQRVGPFQIRIQHFGHQHHAVINDARKHISYRGVIDRQTKR
jgi:hypothetical protein